MTIYTKEQVEHAYLALRGQVAIPDEALDQMRDVLLGAAEPVDTALKKGDSVYAKGWGLNGGKVEIVDINWSAYCAPAAAVKLGPNGGIVVWPLRNLSTTPIKKGQAEPVQSIANEGGDLDPVNIIFNGQRIQVEPIEFTYNAIKRLAGCEEQNAKVEYLREPGTWMLMESEQHLQMAEGLRIRVGLILNPR